MIRALEELLTDLDNVPEQIRMAVRNNGGGHYNHSLFWSTVTPNTQKPSESLVTEIQKSFATLEDFKEQFTKAALTRFGSGWAWLAVNTTTNEKTLEVLSTPNQDSPLMQGKKTNTWIRCLGTCLLLKVSKQTCGVCQKLVECC